jgi:hypothetical protein
LSDLRVLWDLRVGHPLPSPGGAGDPPATSECRLDGGVQMRITVWFVGAGFKPARSLAFHRGNPPRREPAMSLSNGATPLVMVAK